MEEGKAKKKAGGAAKVDRPALKKKLKSLKKAREAARESGDATQLTRLRRRYRRANLKLRRSAPPKAPAAEAKAS